MSKRKGHNPLSGKRKVSFKIKEAFLKKGVAAKLPVNSIVVTGLNPRVMLIPSLELINSLNTAGMAEPIIVAMTERDGLRRWMLLDGELRLKAARSLEWPEIDCIIIPMSENKVKEYFKELTLYRNLLVAMGRTYGYGKELHDNKPHH